MRIAFIDTLCEAEPIRNDVCSHNGNDKIVSVGGGCACGPSGYTHHGLGDVADSE
jgi:transketolase C-terminal domain/subunit